MSAKTTVIDGKKFREVSRKANVGDLVKITCVSPNYGFFSQGNIGKVVGVGAVDDRVDFSGFNNVGFDKACGGQWYVGPNSGSSEYVILEPAVPIDGRTAEVTEAGRRYSGYDAFAKKYGYPDAVGRDAYKPQNGDMVTLLVSGPHGTLAGVTIWVVQNAEGKRALIGERGLKITEKAAEPSADLRAQIDGLTQTVARLTLKVTELERKSSVEVLAQKLDDAIRVSFKPEKITRDEIVEMAKKDVAELTADIYDGRGYEKYALLKGVGHVKTDFVVNKEKRTVVALIRLRYCADNPKLVGKARCAPDDCFNVHIGKAIALRRALGLTVPSEYLAAPQPEGVRVGDVVKAKDSGFLPNSSGPVMKVTEDTHGGIYYRNPAALRPDGLIYDYVKDVIVSDDSREEVAA
ncbi:hypothetical protein [Paenibacillus sp. SI8]|uniref:hypothetical protein n=1 Tax=unclassified Paenibacillus TaxID=185978 RepID=UPI003465AFA3